MVSKPLNKLHQGGPTSSKAILKNPPCIHKKGLAGNPLTMQSCLYAQRPHQGGPTSSKTILKIPPCIHKKVLASSNALTIQICLYAHKPHQEGSTSSKTIFKYFPLHPQERISRQFPYHSVFHCMNTSPTKEAQQALTIF